MVRKQQSKKSETIDFIMIGLIFIVPFVIWLVNELGIIEIPFTRAIMIIGFIVALGIFALLDRIFKRQLF